VDVIEAVPRLIQPSVFVVLNAPDYTDQSINAFLFDTQPIVSAFQYLYEDYTNLRLVVVCQRIFSDVIERAVHKSCQFGENGLTVFEAGNRLADYRYDELLAFSFSEETGYTLLVELPPGLLTAGAEIEHYNPFLHIASDTGVSSRFQNYVSQLR
jgi:hypothetical protein